MRVMTDDVPWPPQQHPIWTTLEFELSYQGLLQNDILVLILNSCNLDRHGVYHGHCSPGTTSKNFLCCGFVRGSPYPSYTRGMLRSQPKLRRGGRIESGAIAESGLIASYFRNTALGDASPPVAVPGRKYFACTRHGSCNGSPSPGFMISQDNSDRNRNNWDLQFGRWWIGNSSTAAPIRRALGDCVGFTTVSWSQRSRHWKSFGWASDMVVFLHRLAHENRHTKGRNRGFGRAYEKSTKELMRW